MLTFGAAGELWKGSLGAIASSRQAATVTRAARLRSRSDAFPLVTSRKPPPQAGPTPFRMVQTQTRSLIVPLGCQLPVRRLCGGANRVGLVNGNKSAPRSNHLGCTSSRPPGLAGGGIIRILPSSGGGFGISGSIPLGGSMTPCWRLSLSLREPGGASGTGLVGTGVGSSFSGGVRVGSPG